VKLIYYIDRLITCKVRYFKPLLVIMLMIMMNPKFKMRIL